MTIVPAFPVYHCVT